MYDRLWNSNWDCGSWRISGNLVGLPERWNPRTCPKMGVSTHACTNAHTYSRARTQIKWSLSRKFTTFSIRQTTSLMVNMADYAGCHTIVKHQNLRRYVSSHMDNKQYEWDLQLDSFFPDKIEENPCSINSFVDIKINEKLLVN